MSEINTDLAIDLATVVVQYLPVLMYTLNFSCVLSTIHIKHSKPFKDTCENKPENTLLSEKVLKIYSLGNGKVSKVQIHVTLSGFLLITPTM